VQEVDNYVFTGTMQEAKASEYVLVYDPDTNTFTLERISTMTRLSAPRTAKPSSNGLPPNLSVGSEDIPTISLDPPVLSDNEPIEEDPFDDEDPPSSMPSIITPRLPTTQPSYTEKNINLSADDDVSDEDLDNLAIELESSLENHDASSSSSGDSDRPAAKAKVPDFKNVPRSTGPISMSRFAGGRRRAEEEEESSDSSEDGD
jgi:RNA polymerase II transcription elongation factor